MLDNGNPVSDDVLQEEARKQESNESLENITERLKAHIGEHIEDIASSVRADYKTHDFSIENFLTDLGMEVDYKDMPSNVQAEIRALVFSEEVTTIFRENGVEAKEEDGNIALLPILETKEGEKTVHLTFTNPHPCVDCKNPVSIEADVPESMAGKWKKDKKTGKQFRDWDYGNVPCTECAKLGKKSEVFVYHREWKEE